MTPQNEVKLTKNKTTAPKMSVAAARAAGIGTETVKKYGAGGNRSAHSANMARLENADDVGSIAKVSTETKKLIMQARMAKKMSQKDLATAINEKPQTIQEYESGKAIPNNQLLAKMEKVRDGCELARLRLHMLSLRVGRVPLASHGCQRVSRHLTRRLLLHPIPCRTPARIRTGAVRA